MNLLTCGVVAGPTEQKETIFAPTWGHLCSYFHTEEPTRDKVEIKAWSAKSLNPFLNGL